jgi:hypothetical protein
MDDSASRLLTFVSDSYGVDDGPRKPAVSAHERGVHTSYSWELLRVTLRVNLGAMWGLPEAMIPPPPSASIPMTFP